MQNTKTVDNTHATAGAVLKKHIEKSFVLHTN